MKNEIYVVKTKMCEVKLDFSVLSYFKHTYEYLAKQYNM